MSLDLMRIDYDDLKPRQQENYNFHKLAARLADFGFSAIRLTDDWKRADFVAQHKDGETFLKVQLKGRLTFAKKYREKELYIAFPEDGEWYVFPHDELLSEAKQETNMVNTSAWQDGGVFSWPQIPDDMQDPLEPHKVGGDDLQVD
jgi:hypothetical protein